MSDHEEQRRLELECLRLAADFRQIASDTLNPKLRTQCLRMATIWAELGPDVAPESVAPLSLVVH